MIDLFYNFNKIDLIEGFAEDIRKINMSGHSKQSSTNKEENNEREVSVKTNKDNKGGNVNHPAHYGGDTTYEAIKVIEAWSLGFCLGNTVKSYAFQVSGDLEGQIRLRRGEIFLIDSAQKL